MFWTEIKKDTLCCIIRELSELLAYIYIPIKMFLTVPCLSSYEKLSNFISCYILNSFEVGLNVYFCCCRTDIEGETAV